MSILHFPAELHVQILSYIEDQNDILSYLVCFPLGPLEFVSIRKIENPLALAFETKSSRYCCGVVKELYKKYSSRYGTYFLIKLLIKNKHKITLSRLKCFDTELQLCVDDIRKLIIEVFEFPRCRGEIIQYLIMESQCLSKSGNGVNKISIFEDNFTI